MNDVGPGTSKSMATILIQLKPYTQYALYVETSMIATAKTGAMSDITYFTTKPDGMSHMPFSLYRSVSSTKGHSVSNHPK